MHQIDMKTVLFVFVAILSPVISCNLLIDQVCQNSEPVDLITKTQIKELAKNIDQNDRAESCSWRSKLAIKELELLIDLNAGCTRSKVEQFRNYHLNYLVDENAKIPTSLRDFVIIYGLKLAQTCREQAIGSINQEDVSMLLKNDEQFSDLSKADGLLSRVIAEPTDQYNEIAPPESLFRILRPGGKLVEERKVYLQTDTGDAFRMMQVKCRLHYKPVYEIAIVPMLILSDVGYNLKSASETLEDNERLYSWYRVMFLCETLSNIIIVNCPEKHCLRFMSIDEAKQLELAKPESFKITNPDSGMEDLELFDYKPLNGVTDLSDEILQADEIPLITMMIKQFYVQKSIVESFKSSLMNKIAGGQSFRNANELMMAIGGFNSQERFKPAEPNSVSNAILTLMEGARWDFVSARNLINQKLNAGDHAS